MQSKLKYSGPPFAGDPLQPSQGPPGTTLRNHWSIKCINRWEVVCMITVSIQISISVEEEVFRSKRTNTCTSKCPKSYLCKSRRENMTL